MSSLSDQLCKLATPTPLIDDRDPEDVNAETTARVVEKFSEDYDDHVEESTLRKKTAQLLQETDVRYAGRKISRKDLDLAEKVSESSASEDVESDEGEEEESEDGEDDEDAILSFKKQLQDQKRHIGREDIGEEDGTDDVDEDDESEEKSEGENRSSDGGDTEESQDDDDDAEMDEQSDEDVIQKFSKIDVEDEIEKGKHVKAQLGIWDSLLECRIKFRKALCTANKLPQHDVWEEFQEKGKPEFDESLKAARKSVEKLLTLLLMLQTELLSRNPETISISSEENKTTAHKRDIIAGDEEIPSDTDEDISGDIPEEAQNAKSMKPKKRKLKFHEYPKVLAKRHKDFHDYRNATIQKWNDRTRLASGKLSRKSFTAFEQSALKQIEQILTDKKRLITRTQLKRTPYRVLGKPETKDQEKVENSGKQVTEDSIPNLNDHLKDYDPEIFDDDDFYHQLLRELIERKTADVQDPIALSRKWLEIQKLRNKMKKNVDTKASKGRRIRYDVHPKLVNFMVPVSYCTLTEEARNELFSSLFGRRSKSS